MRRPLHGPYSAFTRHCTRKQTLHTCVLACGAILIISTVFISYQFITGGASCPAKNVVPNTHSTSPVGGDTPLINILLNNRDGFDDGDDESWGPHKMALVVPFRDRFDEILEFVPHMHNFLNGQRVRHKIFIINQADLYRFNRAALINVGFLESSSECDYICMHDVDLLPLNTDLNYSYPDIGPLHVAAPELHPKYHYRTFIGGILLLKKEHFQLVNGLSNNYWGWGLEDDELYVRIKQAGLQVSRPVGIKTTHVDTFKHMHDRARRPRDGRRFGNQKKASRKRDYNSGVNTVQYKLVSTQLIHIDRSPATVINVELECDLDVTPWCKEPEPPPPRSKQSGGQIAAPNARWCYYLVDLSFQNAVVGGPSIPCVSYDCKLMK